MLQAAPDGEDEDEDEEDGEDDGDDKKDTVNLVEEEGEEEEDKEHDPEDSPEEEEEEEPKKRPAGAQCRSDEGKAAVSALHKGRADHPGGHGKRCLECTSLFINLLSHIM